MTRRQARPFSEAQREQRRSTLYSGCLIVLGAVATVASVGVALIVLFTAGPA